MQLDEARAIIKETKKDYTLTQRVFAGMAILSRHDQDMEVEASHECIYVSSFEKTVAQMSREEVTIMAQMAWFEDEESWAHFI